MRSPILFLVFNRPQLTSRVFQSIRDARPPRLYVAADGPRPERIGEEMLCAQVRDIVATVDWPCEVSTLFRQRNLGCKEAVSRAIDWFFKHEAEGIILEDDCFPDPTFFRFCDELLERYRDVATVGMISGDNFQIGRTHGDHSYYFSRYAHIWGWATWRRAWRFYDRDAGFWPKFRTEGGLERVLGTRRQEIRHWRRAFDAVYRGKVDTWDHQLNLMLWTRGMVSALPQKNLIRNIGFGADATHTTGASKFADMQLEQLEFPLRHPSVVRNCVEADDFTAQHMYVRSFSTRAITRLRAISRRLSGR